jgi:hypothetical protein
MHGGIVEGQRRRGIDVTMTADVGLPGAGDNRKVKVFRTQALPMCDRIGAAASGKSAWHQLVCTGYILQNPCADESNISEKAHGELL